MSFEPICDGHGGFRGSQPGKPNRLLVKSNAKTGAGKEQKNRRRDQLSLPFESKKSPQREAGAPRRTVRAGDGPGHILKGKERITGNAEPEEKTFYPGPVDACIGIDLRSGGFIENGLGQTCAAGAGLGERMFFSLEFAAGHVKPLQGFARGGTRIPRGTRGLGRNGRIGSGKTGMERTGESRGRIAGNIGGIDVKRDNFAEIRRSRSSRRTAQLLDRLDELRQGKALTRAGWPEKTDREGGFGAPVGGELGEKAKRRVEPQREKPD